MIYLDNAATTSLSESVLDAMMPYLKEEFGNPGGIYAMGRRARAAIDNAREQCAAAINAQPDQIIFTSGGTEANVLAIHGAARYMKAIGRTRIVTSPVEHKSVLSPIDILCQQGFTRTYAHPLTLPASEGFPDHCTVTPGMVELRTFNDVGLVSVMSVNNETGTINDIAGIGRVAHKYNALFHTDCVQGFGCVPIDVEKDEIDLMSVSGHKIHGPKGVGFLFAREKDILFPIIPGGGQEYGLRCGTENVAAIVGMGVAAELAVRDLEKKQAHYQQLHTEFLRTFQDSGMTGVTVNGNPGYGSRVLSVTFDGVDAETLILMLDGKGVVVSAGAACSAHLSKPSEVLLAFGLTEEQARSTIRVSFSDDNTLDGVAAAGEIVAQCVKALRSYQD